MMISPHARAVKTVGLAQTFLGRQDLQILAERYDKLRAKHEAAGKTFLRDETEVGTTDDGTRYMIIKMHFDLPNEEVTA